mmetsp:Transcript_85496/g.147813  ORF Transcript_85496/g.147813 Transcript_85496/m.147813 type:complete len:889 (-) Transcript_85496:87-2753(-)
MSKRDTSYRVLLPSDVLPEQYDLTLEPDLERFSFEGLVKISCEVSVATDEVTLHARDLLVSSAKFIPCDGGKELEAEEIALKPKKMTVKLGFDEVLPVGKGVIEIKFTGILNDKMAGFYRSQYTDSKGVKRHLATTQFEAIDARRCFPCWDEPARKAVFVVTMVYPADLTAISNMPPSRVVVEKGGKKRETFMPTPKMSTYLLAFCVGEFEYIGGTTKGGTLARVYACPGNTARCDYALKVCIRALEFYNEFFGIPYPLPKVDMIAIPDFSAGAMENWGLITYREVALLCDEKTVSATQKQRICSVIAHELAHQWFGNLVTMGWWDDLWLNEGFANWMQTFASDKLHPEWNIWETYVGVEQQRALQLDALRSSHPIQVPIKEAEEVEEVFDAISYCKGGSVVRMIYAVLGEEKFQEGLKLYFSRHQFGNTETIDLWNAWKDVSGKPIDQMMGSWTEQMGFPLLKVLNDPSDGSDAVEVEQCWFLADGSIQAGDDSKAWFTPVLMGSDKGTAPVTFMEPPSKKQKLSCGGCANSASWVKLNYGQHVPVRVLYPEGMMSKLSAGVASLPAEDRIGLLSDSFALAKAGAMDAMQLVQLLKGFGGETNDKVWAELQATLGGLNKVVGQGLSAETSQAFVAFASKLVSPAFALVGWEASPSDDDNRKKLRSTLVDAVAKYCYKDAAIVADAMKRFEAFVAAPNDSSVLSADIRPAVLSIAMQSQGTEAVFDKLVAAHDAASDGAVKIHIYSAMGAAPTPALKAKVLDWLQGDAVRSQDLIYIPMGMATGSKEGADTIFAFIKDKYDFIHAKLGTTSMILFNHFVRISGAGFVTEEKAVEVEEFWKSRPCYKMIEKSLSQTKEGVLSSAKFVERLLASDVSKESTWTAAADSKL